MACGEAKSKSTFSDKGCCPCADHLVLLTRVRDALKLQGCRPSDVPRRVIAKYLRDTPAVQTAAKHEISTEWIDKYEKFALVPTPVTATAAAAGVESPPAKRSRIGKDPGRVFAAHIEGVEGTVNLLHGPELVPQLSTEEAFSELSDSDKFVSLHRTAQAFRRTLVGFDLETKKVAETVRDANQRTFGTREELRELDQEYRQNFRREVYIDRNNNDVEPFDLKVGGLPYSFVSARRELRQLQAEVKGLSASRQGKRIAQLEEELVRARQETHLLAEELRHLKMLFRIKLEQDHRHIGASLHQAFLSDLTFEYVFTFGNAGNQEELVPESLSL